MIFCNNWKAFIIFSIFLKLQMDLSEMLSSRYLSPQISSILHSIQLESMEQFLS